MKPGHAAFSLLCTLLASVPAPEASATERVSGGESPIVFPAGCKPATLGKKIGAARTALLIANEAYTANGPLDTLYTPIKDAKGIGDRLGAMGFSVMRCENLRSKEIENAVWAFAKTLEDATGDISLFYFAGHGGQDVVYGTDYRIGHALSAPVKLSTILGLLDPDATKRTGAAIFVIDACRTSPTRQVERPEPAQSLLPVTAPDGSYVVYSTAPGKAAQDAPTGEEGRSVFADFFVKELKSTPSAEVDELFRKVRLKVKEKTKGKQIPWTSHSLVRRVRLQEPS